MVLAEGAPKVAVREEDGARAAAAGNHRFLTVMGVPGGDGRIGAGGALTELVPPIDLAGAWTHRTIGEQPIELRDPFVELTTPRKPHIARPPGL